MKHYHLRPFIPTWTIHAESLEEAKRIFYERWESDQINYFADGNPIVEEKGDRHCDYCEVK